MGRKSLSTYEAEAKAEFKQYLIEEEKLSPVQEFDSWDLPRIVKYYGAEWPRFRDNSTYRESRIPWSMAKHNHIEKILR